MRTKTFSFEEVLTEAQVKLAEDTFRKFQRELVRPEPFAQWARREIITPEVMLRIDAMTEQENDPMYMAYVLEYALLTSAAK